MYDGGVLIAADSRTTSGSLIANNTSDKLEPLHQRIYAQRCGVSAHTRAVCRYTRYYLDAHTAELQDLPLVETAAKVVQGIFYKNQGALSGSMLVSGWDRLKGPQIYDVAKGNCIESKIAYHGSGSVFMAGYLDKNFREGMSKAEAYDLLKEAISLATYRDGGSGGNIRMVDITEEGIKREYIEYSERDYR